MTLAEGRDGVTAEVNDPVLDLDVVAGIWMGIVGVGMSLVLVHKKQINQWYDTSSD